MATISAGPPSQAWASTTRVLLVDDNDAVRRALADLISSWPGYEVVAALDSADDLVPAAARAQPHIVVLDIDMPGRSARHALSELRRRPNRTSVLVLSALGDEQTVRACLDAGASGYVFKLDGTEALREGLAATLSGRRYLSRGVQDLV